MDDKSGVARILVVDDEVMLARHLAEVAASLGCRADFVSGGERALEMISVERYDLVVTDINMDDMDGLALMERLSETGNPPGVVVITGFANMGVAIACLKKGALDFLVKPFEEEEFRESLTKALARGRAGGLGEPDWDEVERHYGLTRRQRDILTAFYRTGKRNVDLANDLFLSPHTVKSHLRAALEKLGADNRAQLIRILRS